MKNFLKISLACLCLLISFSVLKAQCNVSKSDISMKEIKIFSPDPSIQKTKIEVSIKNGMVQRIEVGDNICSTDGYNGVYRCTGVFENPRGCNDAPSPELKCYVTELSCPTREDGCVVVIAGKGCPTPPPPSEEDPSNPH